jgi:hypothetical protein
MPETKIAPTEAKSREQHEALVAANKKLIDETTSKVKAEGHRQRGQRQDDQARAQGRSDRG